MQSLSLKKNWKLDSDAFRHLLQWFDQGNDSNGERYLEIYNRLVSYFDRKNCINPHELADETLNRVARRLSEEKNLIDENPLKFCYLTAKYIFLESLRAKEKLEISTDELTQELKVAKKNNEDLLKEKRLNCLENCTDNLKPNDRELILNYYFGEEKIKNRRELALKFNLSANALTIKACRIRAKLFDCVKKCCEKK
jgi:DNA-directed RNA polymerase specialized sigma24 family protein